MRRAEAHTGTSNWCCRAPFHCHARTNPHGAQTQSVPKGLGTNSACAALLNQRALENHESRFNVPGDILTT